MDMEIAIAARLVMDRENGGDAAAGELHADHILGGADMILAPVG
jgi:hypothetical protein